MSASSNVQNEIDLGDDNMMDLEPVGTPPSQPPMSATVSATNTTSEPEPQNPPELREEALNLQGVDDLSTKDVKTYIREILGPNILFSLEWVNDSSINVVFDTIPESTAALQKLTSEAVYYDEESSNLTPASVRPAKPIPNHENHRLFIRTAFTTDRKVRGARVQSRYYLLHGEPKQPHIDRRKRRPDPRAPKRVADAIEDTADLFPELAAANPRPDDDDELFPQYARAERTSGLKSHALAARLDPPTGSKIAEDESGKWKSDFEKFQSDSDEDLFPELKDRRNERNDRNRRSSRSRSPGRRLEERLDTNRGRDRLESIFGKGFTDDKPGRRGRKKRAHDLFG